MHPQLPHVTPPAKPFLQRALCRAPATPQVLRDERPWQLAVGCAPPRHPLHRDGREGAAVRAALAGCRLCMGFTFAAASRTRCGGGGVLLLARRCYGAASGRRPTLPQVLDALHTMQLPPSLEDLKRDKAGLKKKYRELVKQNHPDAGGSEAQMSKITVAYDLLQSITKKEMEEYIMLQKMNRSGYSAGAAPRYGNGVYRQDPRYAYQNPHAAGASGGYHPNYHQQQRPEGAGFNAYYYQQDGSAAYERTRAQANAYWSQFRHDKQFYQHMEQNPAWASNPFSIFTHVQRARNMSSSSLIVQGLVFYLIFSFIFLLAYRSVRDYKNEEGWKMSESLARHEQMQEIHRIRAEMQERQRQQQQQNVIHQSAVDEHGGPINIYGNAYQSMQLSQQENPLLRNLRVGESPEARAIEYARLRRIQLQQEEQQQQQRMANAAFVDGSVGSAGSLTNTLYLKGWPTVSDEEGRIIKRAQDPNGIIYYEPTREQSRQRQVQNQIRGRLFQSAQERPQPAGPSVGCAADAEGAAALSAAAAAARGGKNTAGQAAVDVAANGTVLYGAPPAEAAAKPERGKFYALLDKFNSGKGADDKGRPAAPPPAASPQQHQALLQQQLLSQHRHPSAPHAAEASPPPPPPERNVASVVVLNRDDANHQYTVHTQAGPGSDQAAAVSEEAATLLALRSMFGKILEGQPAAALVQPPAGEEAKRES
ncbi:chaperone protein DNAJ [Strigomonas culicis]|uniref:Chaperone protein DNAJ n=1 Tax=Strigomonas culicis TaxID=28005 RepID=S9VDT4_9TRYP|nr:chaperone protein DNAJ [Strigomonas culicis]|eukprot:EPY21230.1 chaperone protein DNAJ [Strigomonas culicis]